MLFELWRWIHRMDNLGNLQRPNVWSTRLAVFCNSGGGILHHNLVNISYATFRDHGREWKLQRMDQRSTHRQFFHIAIHIFLVTFIYEYADCKCIYRPNGRLSGQYGVLARPLRTL